jgi:hypothetical protein
MTVDLPVPLPPAQRAALLSSAGPARFRHFIGRAADSERVWGLRDANGWVTLTDDSGAMGFPVWPHPDYATACATDIWAGHGPAGIDVYEFIEKWLPDMAERKISVAVFPIPPMKGVWMAPDELRACLIEELEKYA